MSDEYKLRFTMLLLESSALNVVSLSPPEHVNTYVKLMDVLDKHYGPQSDRDGNLNRLLSRKQLPNEPLFTYYNDMLECFTSSKVGDAQMQKDLFVNGLLPEIRGHVMVARPKTTQEAYEIASLLYSQARDGRQKVASLNKTVAAANIGPPGFSQGNKHTSIQYEMHPRARPQNDNANGPRYYGNPPWLSQRQQDGGYRRDGRASGCFYCGGTNHWARHCLLRSERSGQYNDESRGTPLYQRPPYPHSTQLPGRHDIAGPNYRGLTYCGDCQTTHTPGTHVRNIASSSPRPRPQQQARNTRTANAYDSRESATRQFPHLN